MSGSSLDGLDIAYCHIEESRGQWTYTIQAAACIPYSAQWQQDLQGAAQKSVTDFLELHSAYGRYIGDCVNAFVAEQGLDLKVDFIVSHGHTVHHNPAKQTSFQLGCGASIAATTQLQVINDLRAMDVALQGQGAPIVPIGDYFLFHPYTYLLNLGGIANITIKQGQSMLAFDIGVANQADLLQSSLDLNALLQAKQNQLLVLDQVKADLYNSMVVPANSNYIFTDSIQVDQKMILSDVESKMKAHPLLQSAQQLINVNQFLEKETKALMYPTLRANTGFNYNSNKSAAGFILLNESYGPFLGFNLSIPIYAGTANKRAYKNAQINTVSAKIQYDNTAQNLSTELFKTYQNYQNSLKQTPVEIENYKMSDALLSLVMERFKLGEATIVDVKQAQQSFETAGFRLTSLQFSAKIAEIELKRMSNQLNF